MAKGQTRRRAMADKKLRKARAMENPSFSSLYGRKRKYLDREGGWGWEYPDKPWK